MESFFRSLRDMRFGLRSLARAKGLGAAAIVVLALGIGANSAIFSVTSALLVRPLPFRDPDRLVLVFENLASRRSVRLMPSAPAFEDIRFEGEAFEDVAALARGEGSLDLGDRAVAVRVSRVTTELLPLLGAPLELGRGFLPGEDAPGKDQVAVLSHGQWVQQFRGERAALGRQIVLDGVKRTVVGVLAEGFTPFFPSDVWLPLTLTPAQLGQDRRDYGLLLVIGRLREGVSLPDAQERMNELARHLREEHPDSGRSGLQVVPMREVFLGDLRPALLLLMGAVGFVLLIACANVANLLLVRATARQRELAVRAALGASRGRLMRQLISEGLALALCGGGLGLLIALWAIELLVPIGSETIRASRIEVDGRVVLFTLVISLLAGLVAGLVPALQATRPDLTTQLKDGARRATSAGRRRMRDALVIFEVALAFLLLIAAGHEVRSYRNLLRVDPGFEANGAVAVGLSLPPYRYPDGESQGRFFHSLLERTSQLPGIDSAGFVMNVPLGGGGSLWHFDVEGPGGRGTGHVVELLQVWSPGAEKALRIPLVSGRGLQESDDQGAPRVALVNEVLARRYWPGEEALGKRVRPYRFHFEDAQGRRYWPQGPDQAPSGVQPTPPWFTIVGVIGNVKQVKLSVEPRAEVILPLAQFPVPEGALILRASNPGRVGALLEAARTALGKLDPNLAPEEAAPLRQIAVDSAAQQRDPMILLALLALFAVVMAGMGIYGVMSWVVAERGRELSIRMALGAPPQGVLKLVLREGLRLALAGIIAGWVCAFALAGPLGRISMGLSRLDPLLCLVLSGLLLLVALLASLLPARKAARIDPRVAFRLD